jgi:DNA anti-recombination protein RmuC
VEGSVDKSIKDMTQKMDAMKQQVQQEMKPELTKVKGVAESAFEGLNAYKQIAGAEASDLQESVKKSLTELAEQMSEVSEEVDKVKGSVAEMQSDVDINKLLFDATKSMP